MYDSDVLTDAGRAFQARAAATGNARSQYDVKTPQDLDMDFSDPIFNSSLCLKETFIV